MQSPERETPLPDQLGGKTGERGEIDEGLNRSLARYGSAKRHTLRLLRELGKERALRLGLDWYTISDCGDWLKLRDYFRVGRVKLHSANFCKKHLVCGLCAIRRGARAMAVYLEKARAVEGFGDTVLPFLITTTVLNGDDLAERLRHLLCNYRRLLKRRHLVRGSVMDSVLGGVYSVEVTNTGRGWHPHIHALWLIRAPFFITPTLRREWEALTKDSHQCDVSPIAPGVDLGPGVDAYVEGFCEVFKYATKPAELGADLFAEAYPVLRGKRLLGSFGCLRGVQVPEDLADDLTGLETEPYVEFLAHYVSGGRYWTSTTGEVFSGADASAGHG